MLRMTENDVQSVGCIDVEPEQQGRYIVVICPACCAQVFEESWEGGGEALEAHLNYFHAGRS